MVGPASIEGGAAAFTTAWAAGARPTAVLAMSDAIAIGVIRAARQLGVHVPSQLSVVGFDDIDIAALIDPPLTTIRQPIREKGEEAARLLLAALVDPNGASVQSRRLETRLVVRGSSAAAPRARQEVARTS